MLSERKIKVGEFVKDIRAGLKDSELMEKYKLSVRGLRRIFKQIVDARIMQASEIYSRWPTYEDTVDLDDFRESTRAPVYFPLPVFEKDRPSARGVLEDISLEGLRIAGIEAKPSDRKTLVVPADKLFMIDAVVVEAVCRWSRKGEGAAHRVLAGFEVSRVLEGNIQDLMIMIQSFPFQTDGLECGESPDPDDVEEEESTETVDLASLFTHEVTISGSFNIGGVKQTWFGRLIQALPIPAMLVNRSGMLAFLNESCEKISPSYKAMRGRHFASLFPEQALQEAADSISERVFYTRKHESFQAVLQMHEGKIWGRLTLRPVRLGTNRLLLVLVEDLTLEQEQLLLRQRHNEQLLSEIAERKRAQQALLRSERLKAVGELSSGISHNFNNLLQIILGNAQVALSNLDAADAQGVRANLEQIVASSRFGSTTIKRLQDFARMGPDGSLREQEIFDLSKLVAQAVDMTKIWWQTMPEKNGISVRLSSNLQSGCMVEGRQGELFEVAVNLVKNAAEALPEGGDITVNTFREEDTVVLQVSDTGIGIRKDHLAQIFQPFFTTKKSKNSAGIGLASSNNIVRGHGGSISVTSKRGQGTVFSVKLPLAPALVEEPPSTFPVPIERSLRILVIDDMEPVISTIEEALSRHDHRVLGAESGEDGVRLFEEDPTDLVICDLGMPGMNGWEVAKRIKAYCAALGIKKTPFILLTGWADQAKEKSRVAESGVDAIVEKPVGISHLLKVIRDVVKNTDSDPG